jgi:hypothetical protein
MMARAGVLAQITYYNSVPMSSVAQHGRVELVTVDDDGVPIAAPHSEALAGIVFHTK